AVLRNEEDFALQLVQRSTRSAKLSQQQILDVNEPDGLIERPFAQWISRVPRTADDLQILFDRLFRGEHRHVGARHHDLTRRPLGELKDSLDDLAVLFRENARLLRAG